MKNGKLGFGIIGCGVIAPAHRTGIEACEDAELIAVCDFEEDKGKKFAAESGGVKFYKDYEKMVTDPDIDIVSVCTPSGLHGDGIIAAAQAGKHALSEKPLDIKRDRLTEIIKTCRGANVKLGGIFQSRTSEDMIKVREAIRNGLLGPMTLGDAFLKDYRSQAYYNSAGWRGTWALDGGGALMNQGVHGVDLLIWLMNSDVESVFARAEHKVRDIEVEDTAVANLKFKNGAFGTLIGTTSCNPGEARRIELHGKHGTITVSGSKISRWATTTEEDGRAEDTEPPKTVEVQGAVSNPKAISHSGHIWLINDMVQAVKENRDPYVTGESARKAVDLILAIYESAQTGKEVQVYHAD
ncbi:MAG: Gfo/Idh/MocA family oxidoreductase [bacterium]|nr:Gfo/Idh/MocA family oxidoreductase [bacterium]